MTQHFMHGFVDELTKTALMKKVAGALDYVKTESFGPDRKLLGMPAAPKLQSSGWAKNRFGDAAGSEADRQEAPVPKRQPEPPQPPSQPKREFMARDGKGSRQQRGKRGALNLKY